MDFEELKSFTQKSFDGINKSSTFIAIFTNNYVDDPHCLIQLSLSILLDKPIFMLFEKGFAPPKNLIRTLTGYEVIQGKDDDSIKKATEKLKEKVEIFLVKQNLK